MLVDNHTLVTNLLHYDYRVVAIRFLTSCVVNMANNILLLWLSIFVDQSQLVACNKTICC